MSTFKCLFNVSIVSQGYVGWGKRDNNHVIIPCKNYVMTVNFKSEMSLKESKTDYRRK